VPGVVVINCHGAGGRGWRFLFIMNQGVEKFGQMIEKQLPHHPGRARRLLSAAYSFIGFQAAHFPAKKFASSREYLQSYTAKLLSAMLRDPSGAAVVNIFLPCEIFHAMDIRVSAPEALACYVVNTAAEASLIETAEEKGASESLCSFHKVLMGLAESGVLKKPMMIANTTMACDANQLSFRTLADLWHVPHAVIDVPYHVNEDAVAYVASQLKDLSRMTEEACGRKLDEDRLRACLARSVKTQAYYRKYLSLRPGVHLPESMTPEMLSVISNHLYLGLPEAETYSRMLMRDLENAAPHTSEKRILWMHVLPNWQDSLKDIFQGGDNHAAEIIGCDLAFDSLVRMDPEKPYESMARRIVYGSFNGPGQRRIDRALDIAEKMKADGAVIFCQWGCKQTQGIAVAARNSSRRPGFLQSFSTATAATAKRRRRTDRHARARLHRAAGIVLPRCRGSW
jgi:benzoyl-CoA reductase/2-hydroxyglutaryl-CoA dehydratase subunit BcrC/BadD/HgdB